MTRRQQGFTIVELMVAVLLTAIVAGFALAIYVRFSAAYRDQQDLSVAQQAARSATTYIARKLRQAGYLTHTLRLASVAGGGTDVGAVVATDNANGDGTDMLQIFYGDDDAYGVVPSGSLSYDPTTTIVSNATGFAANTVVAAVRTAIPSLGMGCAIYLSAVDTTTNTLTHAPGSGSPWNDAGNPQCAAIPSWNDGNVAFVNFHAIAFRIKPDDSEGTLQESPSGGIVANDWTDLGVGYADLQLAIRVYQPSDTTDDDGDGDPTRDWYSGANMATALTLVPNSELLEVSITIVSRTLRSTTGYASATTPDLTDSTHPNNNALGDHASAAVTIPYLYRVSTTTIDLRNLGVGN